MTPEEQARLQGWLDSARRVVFFGGAGVSTESGLPDFRSRDGLYSLPGTVLPEEILSHRYFSAHPEDFYRFYREKMLLSAQPNPAHLTLARWEREGRLDAVITQNIDGLHQAAGSKRVYELHGSVHRNHCVRCGRAVPLEEILACDGVPYCSCGGVVKPDVVLYGEGLDEETVQGAVQAIAGADLLLVAGTSLTVYPAAGFLDYFTGQHLVLINRDPTPADSQADLVLRDPVGKVLASLK